MRRNSFLTFLKEKSFIIVLTLMLISAGTMAALFSLGGEKNAEENMTAKQEETVVETPSAETKTETKEEPVEQPVKRTTVITKKTDTKEEREEEPASTVMPPMTEAELEDQFLEAEEIAEEIVEEMAEVSAADVIAEGFSEPSLLSLKWPVEGEVLMAFSMDHSVYFKTLAQYQYNPAMIISAEEGTEVVASAAGTVTDVGKSSVYGHYVTMDLGDGYELTYGQLFDITTEVGEVVDAGERFAMVAVPTRSYSTEGENLYFRLTQDGVPVDPALYLEK